MATILVLQHDNHKTPGRLGTTLRDHGFRLDVRRSDRDDGASLPTDLDNIHGVICLGGGQHVDDGLPWLERERELLRASVDAGLPTIGICLGHQLLAQALGGEVARLPEPEVGFPFVNLSNAGQNDAILAGVPWSSRQFMSHAYEVTTPPPGAQVLGSTEDTKVAAFKVGHRAYGFQFHFEADRVIAEAISRAPVGAFAESDETPGQFAEYLDDYYEDAARTGNRIAVNLATLAFPFDALTAV